MTKIEQRRKLIAEAIERLPGYEITNDGRVFATASNWRGYGRREVSQHADRNGYMRVRVVVNGAPKRTRVHQLVAEAFHGSKPTPKHEVRHLNGIPADNRADNLAWGTRSENAIDRKAHGTERSADNGKIGSVKIRGEKGPNAKLTLADALAIKSRTAKGERPIEIARSFPAVSPCTVWNVVAGRTWKHV
jgi:hypothetical protein